MTPGEKPITQLPIEAQVPVLVSKHYGLEAQVRVNKQEAEAHFGKLDSLVDELRIWKARMVGAIVAAGAAGGGVAAAFDKLFGG